VRNAVGGDHPRAEDLKRRWASPCSRVTPPSEEIRQSRVVELPLRLCIGMKLGIAWVQQSLDAITRA
jgi:hypothetical protein